MTEQELANKHMDILLDHFNISGSQPHQIAAANAHLALTLSYTEDRVKELEEQVSQLREQIMDGDKFLKYGKELAMNFYDWATSLPDSDLKYYKENEEGYLSHAELFDKYIESLNK